jgi:hypothetical protein
MKINAEFKVSINSGMALILFLLSLAALLVGVALSPAILSVFFEAAGILTVAFGGYLKKRDSNNQIALKAEIAGLAADPGKDMVHG